MRYCLDRFEGNKAVLEMDDGSTISLAKAKLPKSAKEGDIIVLNNNGKYLLAKDETKKKKERIKKLEDELFRD